MHTATKKLGNFKNNKIKASDKLDEYLVFQYSKLIIDMVGEEEMVDLNNAITDRFIISSILDSFLLTVILKIC